MEELLSDFTGVPMEELLDLTGVMEEPDEGDPLPI